LELPSSSSRTSRRQGDDGEEEKMEEGAFAPTNTTTVAVSKHQEQREAEDTSSEHHAVVSISSLLKSCYYSSVTSEKEKDENEQVKAQAQTQTQTQAQRQTQTQSPQETSSQDEHDEHDEKREKSKSWRKSTCSSLNKLLSSPRSCGNTKTNANTNTKNNGHLSPLAARLSRPSRGTIQVLKEVSNRATAYIIGFFLTYLFTTIHRLMVAYYENDGSDGGEKRVIPVAIVILARFFISLQGFFNVLIYTYPHVFSYRRQHRGASWIHAFWEVIKSGGDSDQVQPKRRKMPKGVGRNRHADSNAGGRNQRSKFSKINTRSSTPMLMRRDSLGNEPAVLDVGQSFVSNVKRIQSNYYDRSNDVVLGDNDRDNDNSILEFFE